LTRTASGVWPETILYSFKDNLVDGTTPYGGVVLDTAGNLYGTAAFGGTSDNGTVFELIHLANGTWEEKVLHDFNGDGDGGVPFAAPVMDASGDLYGTTASEGPEGGGTAFEVSPGVDGKWTETTLYNFVSPNVYEANSLTLDSTGNLYGTANGSAYREGLVFKLSRGTGAKWTVTILHSFNDNGTDGYSPNAGLILNASGKLCGTTAAGGKYGGGTVFEITP
jgi:uncharacterized repeat protein (TIGR03803 family)